MSENKQNIRKAEHKPSKVEETENYVPDESAKNRTRLIITLLVIGFIGVGGYFLWDHIYRETKIDPFANVNVRFQGEGDGAFGMIEINKKLIESDPQLNRVHKAIKYTLEPNYNLKKGDRVVLSAKVPESTQRFMASNKLVFTETQKVYIVQEIHNEIVFDPFDGIKLIYSGSNGEGVAEVDITNVSVPDDITAQLLPMLDYSIINSNELSIGDSVTVSVKPTSSGKAFMNEHQIILAQTSMAFDVDALAKVPKDYDQINILDSLKMSAQKRVEDSLATAVKEMYVCYGVLPKNIANAQDKDTKHPYVNGTLMMVYQYQVNQREFAIASGYTNLMLKGNEIDEELYVPMQPVSVQQTLEHVLLEMQDNNLTCSPTP